MDRKALEELLSEVEALCKQDPLIFSRAQQLRLVYKLDAVHRAPAPAKPCAEVTLTEEERRDLKIISRPNSGPVQNRMAALIKRLLGQGEKK